MYGAFFFWSWTVRQRNRILTQTPKNEKIWGEKSPIRTRLWKKIDQTSGDQVSSTYKDRAAPPIGGPALHDSGVKTV